MGPVSVLFPIGLIAALAALALRGGEAEASEKEKDRTTGPPDKDIILDPYTGLPRVEPLPPRRPSDYGPKPITPTPVQMVPVPGVGPVPRVVTLKEWEKNQQRKRRDNNCPPGTRPEFKPFANSWAEYDCVAAIVRKDEGSKTSAIAVLNQKEATKKIEEYRETPSKVSPSAVKETPSAVSKIVATKEKEKAKESVKEKVKAAKEPSLISRITEAKPSAPITTKKPMEAAPSRVETATLPKVERAEFEPDAKGFVEQAIKSRDVQIIRDSADSMRNDFPRASAYLDKKANELEASTKREQPAKLKDASPVAQIVSKKQWEENKASKAASAKCGPGEEASFKPYSKGWAEYICQVRPEIARGIQTLRAEGIESDVEVSVAVFLSKKPSPNEARAFAKQYEKSKPKASAALLRYAKTTETISDRMARGEPTKPIEVVKAANSTDNPSELLRHAETLKATGNNQAAATVKSRAKDEAAKQGITIIDDAKSSDMLADALVSIDPIEIRTISINLRKAGYPKKSDKVNVHLAEVESSINKARKSKDVSALKEAGFVERKETPTKTVDTAQGKKELATVIRVSEKQAKEDEAKEKERVAKEKKQAEKASKEADAKSILADKDKAKKDAEEKVELERIKKITKQYSKTGTTRDPLEGITAADELEGKKEKKKSEGKVSTSGFDYDPSAPFEIRSPIDGVTDAQWASFVKSMISGKPNSITPSYRLGMFGFGARRLADYGLMDNPRQVSYHGNTVWAGDWLEPWDLNEFLSDYHAQHELFAEDMSNKADYIKESNIVGSLIEGRKASLSGLMAVAFNTTENSFAKWLDSREDRIKFPATLKAFEKANGLF